MSDKKLILTQPQSALKKLTIHLKGYEMSTENTTNEVGSAIEAINFTKNGRSAMGDVRELIVDDTLNIRFHAGSVVYGVEVKADSRDLPSMWLDIVQAGRIIEPIWVSERDDKKRYVLRGNRRTGAAQEGLNKPDLNPALREELTKKCPLLIFKNLTRDQERDLVQDQTQRKFKRSEVVRHVFHLRGMGRSYEQIVLHNYTKLAEMFSTTKMVAEYEAITDQDARLKKLKSWFNGSCRTYLLNAYDMGEFMRKQVMLSEMLLDNLLPKEGEQPYFFTNKNSQKRMVELNTAKNADGVKFNGIMPLALPESEFAKCLAKFHAEDYPDANAPVPEKSATGIMKRDEVKQLEAVSQSKLAKFLLSVVLKGTADWKSHDDAAAIADTKQMLLEQYLPRLNPNTAAILRLCLVSPDVTDFKNFLDGQCGVTEVPSSEIAEGNAETFSLNDGTAKA